MILAGPNGVPRYELAELAAWFNLEAKPKRKATDAPKKATNQQKGYRGQAARWELDERRFWTLVELRGGVRMGTRHAHCFVLGCILAQRYRDLELRAAQVNEQADRLWAAFLDRKEYTQRLVEREVQRAAFGNGGKPMKIAHDTIAQRLLITEGEAVAIAERTGRLITQSWPTKNGPIEVDVPLTRSQRAERRQQWILANEQFARRATVRQLADALTAAGMECTAPTATQDRLAAFGPTEPSTPSLF
jgi:hypothetical protein